jgi:hypothetical protein
MRGDPRHASSASPRLLHGSLISDYARAVINEMLPVAPEVRMSGISPQIDWTRHVDYDRVHEGVDATPRIVNAT